LSLFDENMISLWKKVANFKPGFGYGLGSGSAFVKKAGIGPGFAYNECGSETLA
jgi:hypothetical protein